MPGASWATWVTSPDADSGRFNTKFVSTLPPPGNTYPVRCPVAKHDERIKFFHAEKGYSFIECAALQAHYNRDVFVHKAQLCEMKVGTVVTFSLETNTQNMPRAKDLQEIEGSQAAGLLVAKGGGQETETEFLESPVRCRDPQAALAQQHDDALPQADLNLHESSQAW